MLIIRGVNVFPSQVEHVLVRTAGTEPHYRLVLRREKALDQIEVQVEASAEMHAAGPAAITELAARIRRSLHEQLGITVEVAILPPKSLERSVGKAQRLLDLRETT